MGTTFHEYLYGVAIMAAVGYLIIAGVSYVLHFIVALTSPPIKRARWTAGPGYIIAAATLTSVVLAGEKDLEILGWCGPLLAVPGGLFWYRYWRKEFTRAWIDDCQGIPEDVELENDDWRIGFIGIVAIAAVVAAKVLFRLATHGPVNPPTGG